MQLEEVLKKRKMVREYSNTPIPQKVVDEILFRASKAPSAGYLKPQKVIPITNKKTKQYLHKFAWMQDWVLSAPLLLVVIADSSKNFPKYGARAIERYCTIDASFTSMIILLMAIEKGLGACFVGAFDDDMVRNILDLHQYEIPIGIICLGYPK